VAGLRRGGGRRRRRVRAAGLGAATFGGHSVALGGRWRKCSLVFILMERLS
jgi:hypothetical protein